MDIDDQTFARTKNLSLPEFLLFSHPAHPVKQVLLLILPKHSPPETNTILYVNYILTKIFKKENIVQVYSFVSFAIASTLVFWIAAIASITLSNFILSFI